MEFCEKLQELRKEKGMTQDELAEALFVSRAAISKWESGRGYPNLESLKAIAEFFSVTIDELLSSEKIISIAEKENKATVIRICNIVFGIVDCFTLALIVLPLYPRPMDGFIYSVNLPSYTDTPMFSYVIHWVLFIMFILIGISKIILAIMRTEKGQKVLTIISMILSVLGILFIALTQEPYALSFLFMLFVAKVMILIGLVKK